MEPGMAFCRSGSNSGGDFSSGERRKGGEGIGLSFGQEAGGSGSDAVTLSGLDQIHRFVGEMQEAGLVGRIDGKGSDAHAGGNMHI